MADDIADAVTLAELEALIDAWLAEQLDENPVVAAVERGEPRSGAGTSGCTAREGRLHASGSRCGQRTLHYETYVMPAPEENHARSSTSTCCAATASSTGWRSASARRTRCSWRGQLPFHAVDEGELDRILGSLYAYVEQCFRPALRIGFASRFPSA